MKISKSLLITLISITFVLLSYNTCGPEFKHGSEFSASSNISFEDKNSDGVWDDVESYIDKYSSNKMETMALKYKFRAFQEILLDPEIGKEIKRAALNDESSAGAIPTVKTEGTGGEELAGAEDMPGEKLIDHMSKANACLYKVYGPEMKVDLKDIEKVILTSEPRIRAYLRYNDNLSGGTYMLWDEDKQGDPCSGL